MNIDISHISYWAPVLIVTVIIWVLITVLSIVGAATAFKRDWNDLGGFCAGVVLLSIFLGPVVTFVGVGNMTYESQVLESKIEQLSEKYDNVDISDNLFVASLDGQYVQGFLADKGEGKFIALEGRP